jgi:hypothetical protein
MGNNNHVVVSHKLCGFHEFEGGHVMMKEPVVVVPKFGLFIAHFLSGVSEHHSKSQT